MKLNDNAGFAVLCICVAAFYGASLIYGPDGQKDKDRAAQMKFKQMQLDSMKIVNQKK